MWCFVDCDKQFRYFVIKCDRSPLEGFNPWGGIEGKVL